MRSTLVIVVLAIFGADGCDRKNTAPSLARTQTESFIANQVNRPQAFSRQASDLEFVQKHYVPSLKRAKTLLDDVERGKLKTSVLAAFIRPVQDSEYLFWVMWIQADDKTRWLRLADSGGLIGNISIPTPDTAPSENAGRGYIRIDVFHIASPRSRESKEITWTLRTPRAFDVSSLTTVITLDEDGNNPSNSISVSRLDPLPTLEP